MKTTIKDMLFQKADSRSAHKRIACIIIASLVLITCGIATRENDPLQLSNFALKFHPELPIVNIQVSDEDYVRYLDPSYYRFEDLTRFLYYYFADDFDFIFFFHNEDDRISTFELFPIHYYGSYRMVKNETLGIGLSNEDFTHVYGSAGKLQGIMQFKFLGGLINGPSLHEIMHKWGNFILPTDDPGHWGYSTVAGHVGGYEYDMLTYSCLNLPITFSCSAYDSSFEEFNLFAYAPLELYLMGLIPPSEVTETIALAQNFRNVNSFPNDPDIVVDGFDNYTIERIIEENGPRIPNHTQSQKHFRGLYAIVSTRDLTRAEWESEGAALAQFTNPATDNSPVYNFWEATGGRATFQLDNITTSLKRDPSEH